MKSPHQDEYVAEADMVSRLMANLRLPIIRANPLRVIEGREGKADHYKSRMVCPIPYKIIVRCGGNASRLHNTRISPTRSTLRKGVGRRPVSADKLLCEQRRNLARLSVFLTTG